MSLKISQAKKMLKDKISTAAANKAQKDSSGCDHDWQRYKERIQIDNEHYSGQKQPFFIVLGCEKCKSKRRIDMVFRWG